MSDPSRFQAFPTQNSNPSQPPPSSSQQQFSPPPSRSRVLSGGSGPRPRALLSTSPPRGPPPTTALPPTPVNLSELAPTGSDPNTSTSSLRTVGINPLPAPKPVQPGTNSMAPYSRSSSSSSSGTTATSGTNSGGTNRQQKRKSAGYNPSPVPPPPGPPPSGPLPPILGATPTRNRSTISSPAGSTFSNSSLSAPSTDSSGGDASIGTKSTSPKISPSLSGTGLGAIGAGSLGLGVFNPGSGFDIPRSSATSPAPPSQQQKPGSKTPQNLNSSPHNVSLPLSPPATTIQFDDLLRSPSSSSASSTSIHSHPSLHTASNSPPGPSNTNPQISSDPLPHLLSLLSTSIQTLQTGLKRNNFPPMTLDEPHPFDGSDVLEPPSVWDARKTIVGISEMIAKICRSGPEEIMDMSMRSYEHAAYLLCNRLGILEVFKNDRERRSGLHVSLIVSRLHQRRIPGETKPFKIDRHKLERCLRLLTASYWWSEPSSSVFAPTRFALMDVEGSPAWSYGRPISETVLRECAELMDWILDEERERKEREEGQPPDVDVPVMRVYGGAKATKANARFNERSNITEKSTVRGKVKEDPPFETWYEYLEHNSSSLTHHARSHQFLSALTLSSSLFDYPWESILTNATIVDVGSGVGAVTLPLLQTYYHHEDLTVVLQDRNKHLELAREFWEDQFPQSVQDARVIFEDQNFFKPQPEERANKKCIFFLRWIMHLFTNVNALKVLKHLRTACGHPESRILICENMIEPACPPPTSTNQSPEELAEDFKRTMESIDDNGPYQPITAPYPLPIQFGAAYRQHYRLDMLIMSRIGSQARTIAEFTELARLTGFQVSGEWKLRGLCGIVELVPV